MQAAIPLGNSHCDTIPGRLREGMKEWLSTAEAGVLGQPCIYQNFCPITSPPNTRNIATWLYRYQRSWRAKDPGLHHVERGYIALFGLQIHFRASVETECPLIPWFHVNSASISDPCWHMNVFLKSWGLRQIKDACPTPARRPSHNSVVLSGHGGELLSQAQGWRQSLPGSHGRGSVTLGVLAFWVQIRESEAAARKQTATQAGWELWALGLFEKQAYTKHLYSLLLKYLIRCPAEYFLYFRFLIS